MSTKALISKVITKAGNAFTKREWMADSDSDWCLVCKQKFSISLRRHHCRVCGRLVCGPCSSNSMELEIDGDVQPQRVCDECREKTEIEQGIQVVVGDDLPVDIDTQVLLKVMLLRAKGLCFGPDSQSILSMAPEVRNRTTYVVFYIGEKRIKECEPCQCGGRNAVWDQFFQFRISVTSQCADFLIAEVWDKSRGMNADDMVGKCRIPLYLLGPQQESCQWHTLFKNGRRRGHLAVHIQRGIGGIINEEAPVLSMCIPYAVSIQSIPTEERAQRTVELQKLFPPGSELHPRLFYVSNDTEDSTSTVVPANELILICFEKATLEVKTQALLTSSQGVVLITSHRLLFIPYHTGIYSVLSLPLGEIQNVLIRRRWKDQFHALEVTTKDSVTYIFSLRRIPGAEMKQLQLLRRCQEEIEWLKLEDNFAFVADMCHQSAPELLKAAGVADDVLVENVTNEGHVNCTSPNSGSIKNTNGTSSNCKPSLVIPPTARADEIQWYTTAQALLQRFSLEEEYTRLGYMSHPNWRISNVNSGFRLCPTYPEILAVPSEALGVTDDFLKRASQYRSIQRIPVSTWIHPNTHATLCRSSQPLVGITFSACPEDEQLLMIIRVTVLQLHSKEVATSVLSGAGDSADMTSSWTDITTMRTSARRSSSDSASGSMIPAQSYPTALTSHAATSGESVVLSQQSSAQPRLNSQTSPQRYSMKQRSSSSRLLNNLDDGDNLEARQPIPMLDPAEGVNDGADDESKDLQRQTNQPSHILRIYDARPYINVAGNALMGKGHEVISRLGGPQCTKLKFLNIANIHVMRDSYSLLRQACCCAIEATNCEEDTWLQQLFESKWLRHISFLLAGSMQVANSLHRGDPVLVHCSDGWDRTTQLCSLAQILLDPYYRTITGFRVLIEKDWKAFGHRFNSRSGGDGEQSPVFLQFLDCVWQIWRQFPWMFEFNEPFLVFLARNTQSRWFDDFLFDSLQDRQESMVSLGFEADSHNDGCIGLWYHVAHNLPKFRNIIYSCPPPKSYDIERPLFAVQNAPNDDVISTSNSAFGSPEKVENVQMNSCDKNNSNDREVKLILGEKNADKQNTDTATQQVNVTDCLSQARPISLQHPHKNTSVDNLKRDSGLDAVQVSSPDKLNAGKSDANRSPACASGPMPLSSAHSMHTCAEDPPPDSPSATCFQPARQDVHFLTPGTQSSSLAVWQSVHLRGLPSTTASFVGSAVREICLESYVEEERLRADTLAKSLLDKEHDLEETRRQNLRLAKENERLMQMLHKRVECAVAASAHMRTISTVVRPVNDGWAGEGSEFCPSPADQEGEFTKILGGGFMIDNYM